MGAVRTWQMSMRSYSSLAEALGANDSRVERPFLCPVHSDHNASASVNVQKRVWFCHSCGARGTTEGIYFEERLDLDYIDELLAEHQVLPESYLDLFLPPVPAQYWRDRGFSDEACRHFQLGIDPASGRPTYPLRDAQGQLLGVVTRNITGDGPKYKYPKGVKVHELLFNYTPVIDTVTLVEGALDAVACWDVGFHAMGIYGSSLSDRQVSLLRSTGADRILLAFDNDRAGRAATERAVEQLAGFGDVLVFNWTKWERYGDDVAELTRGQRASALRELLD